MSTVARQFLTGRTATEAWIKRGMLDFFASLELFDLVNLHLFLLQQGLEKFLKAYLIASRAPQYENLDPDKAGEWIDDFVRPMNHDLVVLLKNVSEKNSIVGAHLQDKRFLDLLNKANQEGRYPIPIAKSVYETHGFGAVVSDRNYKKAFAIGKNVLEALKNDFNLNFSMKEPWWPFIVREEWERFGNLWNMAQG